MNSCTDTNSQVIITTTHRRWVTETVNIYEDVDNSTYDHRIIAKMYYRAPIDSKGRTNDLIKHEIYAQNTNPSNLKRFTEVKSWDASNNAADEIANQMDFTFVASTDALTNLTYDAYGNVTKIVGPRNHVSATERSERNFTYETSLNQYVVEISNEFGERVTNRYNYKKQQLIQSVDPSGHPIRYVYDPQNRLTEVWAPREIYDGTKGPTISFSYHPEGLNPNGGDDNAKVPLAFTYHNTGNKDAVVDLRNSSNIDQYRTFLFGTGQLNKVMPSSATTATLTDGTGQAVQIQTESDYDIPGGNKENSSVLRVSGTASKDKFGEITEQRNDFISTSGTLGILIENPTEVIASTLLDYLSRPIEQTSIWSDHDFGISQPAVDNNTTVITNYSYAWRSGLDEHTGLYFSTQVDVAGSNTQTKFVDARGRDIAQRNDAEGIVTEFVYDDLGQLMEVHDPKDLVTSYVYDNFGRVTLENHPDRGQTVTTYDQASNVRTTNWAGQLTTFEYDHGRLKRKIITDNSGENSSLLYNVLYRYGASDGSDGVNNVGRIKEILQGSDEQNPFLKDRFEYDELGQTHRTIRTMDIPNQQVQVFNTYSFYDSFGRVLRLKYPDDEQVDYSYSELGSLESISSQMPGGPIQSIITNMVYDGYDNISYILYGNGTETSYRYHAYTRALMENETQAKSTSGGTQSRMNERQYTYNNKGLISEVDFYVSPSLISQGGNTGWSSFQHTYDQANRLTQSKMIYGGGVSYQVTMNYEKEL